MRDSSCLIRMRRQMEVDEARVRRSRPCATRSLARQRIDDRLRELARIAARGLGQLQRDVGREVAVRGVARALDVDRRTDVGRQDIGRQRRERSLHEFLDLILHEITNSTWDRNGY